MNFRNPTPRQFAIFAALLIALLLTIYLLIYNVLGPNPIDFILLISISFMCLLVAYFVFFWLLEVFIYRKIKLVYKNIHDLKLGKKGFTLDKVSLDKHFLDDVNKEVANWAKEKNEEIFRLEELERYRKEFLGNVFHEIKTPVFSVQGYLHTLSDGAIDDDEVKYQYLEKAVRNIDRLDQIIEDLELITLKEHNRLEIDTIEFDITALIKDVFDALELQADFKDIEFGIKQNCDRPFTVCGDKDKIRQVLVNLINNSIKYGKEGGLIIVGIYDMDENIYVEITDNGIGIEQEKLKRLFERFYRVDESRYRSSGSLGGSGLGLSIVKHIIDAHNQTINVRSTVGVGSTFGFTLKKSCGPNSDL